MNLNDNPKNGLHHSYWFKNEGLKKKEKNLTEEFGVANIRISEEDQRIN